MDSVLFFIPNIDIYGNYITLKIDRVATLRLDDKNFQYSQIILKFKKIDLVGEGWEKAYERIRPWKDGLILVNSRYSDDIYGDNHYVLLDTTARIMKLWKPTGEFEWLNDCMDAKWSKTGGLCLKETADTLGFVLLRNGVDTLAVRYMPNSDFPVCEKGLAFAGNSIMSNGWIYLINGQGQISENPLDMRVLYQNRYGFHLSNSVDYNKKILY
jgi:hypothetical protein